MNRLQELEELILFHNEKYYNGEAEISDVEYDSLIEELRKLNPLSSVLLEVGAVPSFGKKVNHSKVMGSLIKETYLKDGSGDVIGDGLDGLRKWKKEHPEKTVCSWKIDGLAGKLIFKNEKLAEGSTRGNGKVGMDITDNVRAVRSIPTAIKSEIVESYAGKPVKDIEIELRGEFYIPKSFFQKNLFGQYANPRNGTSGALQCQNPQETADKGIEFIVYSIMLDGEEPLSKSDEKMLVESLKGFHGVLESSFKFIDLFDLKIDTETLEKLDEKRQELDYMTDGLVLSIDDMEARNAYGMLADRFPRGMLAWKFKAEQMQTTIMDVEWQTGRTGKITPVAILDPIELAGSVVGKATLHNLSEIKRLGISIGDTVLVEKAGDIIPRIVKVVSGSGANKEYKYPETCPSCKQFTSNDGTNVWCSNQACGAKLLTRIDYYLKTLEIKEIGPAMIQALISAGLVSGIVDMYYLDEDRITELPNCGLRTAQTVMNAILEKNEVELAVFLEALGISGLGKSAGKALARKFKTLNGVRTAKVEDIIDMEGFASITANAIVSGLIDNAETIDGLARVLTIKEYETKQGVFTGKNFCCTGTLNRKRNDIQKMIANAGGDYTSIKKGLDFLIIGEGAVQAKQDKAKSLGAKVITEDEFIAMLG